MYRQWLDKKEMENPNTNNKEGVLFVRLSEDEKAELKTFVANQPGDVTVSQFVRDAFREKIAAIKESANQEPATTGATA